MADKVQLTLTGRQRDGAGGETVTETKAKAEYYERNGSIYILYDETPEDGETVSKNIIKLKDSVLELTKKGAVSARMVFEEGIEHRTDYATPYGCLKLGILTHSVTHSFQNGRRVIRAEYTLLSEGENLCDRIIEILLEDCSDSRCQ